MNPSDVPHLFYSWYKVINVKQKLEDFHHGPKSLSLYKMGLAGKP